ncbi:MAG: hypothetical protein AB9846_05055 [Tenuifilaceae bacterium]
MRHIILLSITLTIALASCTSLSKIGIQEYKSENLSKSDFAKLNGIYRNYPDTAIGQIKESPYPRNSEHLSLFNQFVIGQWGGTQEVFEKQLIKIEFLNHRKAIITLTENEKTLETKIIRGRFKDGYFYSRPKTIIIPIIPLLFGYYFNRFRIGRNGKYLTIDYTVNKWMAGFVVGESSKGHYSSIYKELDKK